MNLTEIKRFREIYIKHLLDEAEVLRKAQMPALSEEKFALFETTGNRLEYEHDYFERRKFLTIFGCVVELDFGKDYILKLEQIISEICDEECWALPAHVNRKEDNDWRITVDLFASETAQALAELYGRLSGVLPENLLKRMRSEVMRRVLIPFDSKQPFAWWERSEMNWNAVCDGSIGMAALMMLDDEPEMQRRIVKRVLENLEYFLNGFSDDGACLEGLGYFTYGFYYYMGFMDLLARKAEKRESIMALLWEPGSKDSPLALADILPDKCRKIAEFQQKCYFPSGLSVSFSDGSKHEKYRIGLTCKLAELFDTVEIPDITSAADFDFDPCYRFVMASRDLMWSGEYCRRSDSDAEYCSRDNSDRDADCLREFIDIRREEGKESPRDGNSDGHFDNETRRQKSNRKYVLPSAQWSICHGASGGGFAIKGGHNAEPHNHNDVGSFIYALGDKPLLTDLGAGEYTAQYFRNETRYEYICCSSLGHNVPVINGCGQRAGREFACESFNCSEKDNSASNMGVDNASERKNTRKGKSIDRIGYEISLSYAEAYSVPELRSMIRNVSYEPETEILDIEDIFDSDGCMIEENLVSQGDAKFVNGVIYIKSDTSESENTAKDSRNQEKQNPEDRNCDADYTCRITSENGFPELKITEEPFMNHEGKPETVKRITWKVGDKTQTGKISFCMRVEPVR